MAGVPLTSSRQDHDLRHCVRHLHTPSQVPPANLPPHLVLHVQYLGLSTFFSVIHGIFIYSIEDLNERMSLSYFTGLGVLNFTGAAIYAARILER